MIGQIWLGEYGGVTGLPPYLVLLRMRDTGFHSGGARAKRTGRLTSLNLDRLKIINTIARLASK